MSECSPIRDQVMNTFDEFPKEYSLSFDLKIESISSEYTNILHITIGGDSGQYGERTIAVFVQPNSSKLDIFSAVNGKLEYGFTTESMPVGEWINLRFAQSPTQSRKRRHEGHHDADQFPGNLFTFHIMYHLTSYDMVHIIHIWYYI